MLTPVKMMRAGYKQHQDSISRMSMKGTEDDIRQLETAAFCKRILNLALGCQTCSACGFLACLVYVRSQNCQHDVIAKVWCIHCHTHSMETSSRAGTCKAYQYFHDSDNPHLLGLQPQSIHGEGFWVLVGRDMLNE